MGAIFETIDKLFRGQVRMIGFDLQGYHLAKNLQGMRKGQLSKRLNIPVFIRRNGVEMT